MECQHDILKDLGQLLLATQSVDELVEDFTSELKKSLTNSDTSMLFSGTVTQNAFKKMESSRDFNSKILAIDFGGTKLKFGIITMPDCKIQFRDEFNLDSARVDLSFFDNITNKICVGLQDFLKDKIGACLKVSVTFSFPLNRSNEIVTMGKGFFMSDEIKGISALRIIGESFKRALKKHEEYLFNIEMGLIINDSVAVHLTGKFLHEGQEVSLIVGTGINTCFEIPFWQLPENKRPNYTEYSATLKAIINAEAGFLGSGMINITPFDSPSDLDCYMPLEFVTAGKWLPLALQKILRHYNYFQPELTSIDGQLLVAIVEGNVKLNVDQACMKFVCEVCKMLLERGAFYLTVTLLAISRLIGHDKNSILQVGYIGSFLENSSYYQQQVKKFSNGMIKLRFSNDSNLIGPAIATYINYSQWD